MSILRLNLPKIQTFEGSSKYVYAAITKVLNWYSLLTCDDTHESRNQKHAAKTDFAMCLCDMIVDSKLRYSVQRPEQNKYNN